MSAFRPLLSFRYGIFDLDGTLIDSVADTDNVYQELLKPLGITDSLDKTLASALTSTRLVDRLRDTFARHGTPISLAAAEELRAEYQRRFLARDYPLCAGAGELLNALHASGMKLFGSSAASDAIVWKRLVHGGLGHLFKLAYGSVATPKGQRHLDIFAETVGEEPNDFAAQAFLCGDTDMDMKMAKDAGLYAIGVEGTMSASALLAAGADRVVRSLTVLLADTE